MIALERRAFGRLGLGLDKVRKSPHDRISALVETRASSLEYTVGRPSAILEEGLTKNHICMEAGSSVSLTVRINTFVFFKPPRLGVFCYDNPIR